MDRPYKHFFVNLTIISGIPKYGKLKTINGKLNIYRPSVTNWIQRKAYGDGKKETIKFLDDFYTKLVQENTKLLLNNSDENVEIIAKLVEKMEKSLVGINNLIETYKDYYYITAQLRVLAEFVKSHCNKVNEPTE